jgi:hypothetical protein
MFSLKDKFKFLDDGIDFPFYNDVPKLSTADWSIVLISVILVIITISLFSSHQALKSVMIFLVTIIPALYICKRNYGLFFKRIRLKDIKTIILSFLGYILYVMLILPLLISALWQFISLLFSHAFVNMHSKWPYFNHVFAYLG